MHNLRLGFFFSLAISLAACGGPNKDGPDARPPAPDDEDGDTISDDDEGRDADRDSDGDGTPDYLDEDSDDDGIPDYREAGDEDAASNPIDSDGDSTPDYLDEDSDGNGISDTDDGTEDIDDDDKGNFADLDDDGDGMNDEFELGDDPSNPVDTDNDTTPDYQDLDSDNDTIGDAQERASDPDQDMVPAFQDDDSDNDCILDINEAGDSDLATLPPDADMDGKMDPLDVDSDNDGLADGDEDGNCNGVVDAGESSSTDADTDGDGVTDLVEDVAGTDPTNPADNPQANGDFFFLVPFEMPTTPPEDTLEFRTSVQFADLYFEFDTTGSMSGELSAMANASTGVPAIISELTCDPAGVTCTLDSDCPANNICFNNACVTDPNFGTGCVPDLWTGVGTFDDKNTYRNRLSIQSNPATTAANIPGTGTGGAEAPIQAAACVGNPSLCTNTGTINCAVGGVGCPGFRASAVRILIFIGDSDQQCSPVDNAACLLTTTQAGDALEAQEIKFVGLWGTSDDSGDPSTPESIHRAIGIASGTVDTQVPPQPFVYPAVDSAVVQNTKDAVIDIVRGLPLNVTIGAVDQPADDGDSLQFIDYLEVNLSGGQCTNVAPTADTNADGHQDAFPSLLPGTPVCWDVIPIPQNDTVPATADPQLFIARLTVYGDGSPLDSRDVFFLIPPVIDDVPLE
jgi:hypothetical protein